MGIALGALALFIGLAVYELWICEGTHLGRRFVVWLYDLAAARYDRIKQFDTQWERRFVGEPLASAVSALDSPLLLDIGAGTGRVARALSGINGFRGTVVDVEPSRRMLALGRKLAPQDRNLWARSWAVPLPFRSGTFDIVVSLEVLEFTPDPLQTLDEAIRVLRAGGWLLVTNRVGAQAPLILGKTFDRETFPKVLQAKGLEEVAVYPWQMDYDLAWARKPNRTV
jgi:ubiquinone/menaquinone biosynthesis C-methylase UbiE